MRELQSLLKALGFYTSNVDGAFGPVTEAAVKRFQRQHGLTVDGWAGPQTMARLRANTGARLARGATGPEVVDLQRRLKSLGFYDGALGGNFGPGTDAAVRAFQRANGLTADGWAGASTLAKLRALTEVGPAVPAAASATMTAAIEWAKTQLGAPSVGGASPFRFGTPGDGRTYQQQGQHAYVSPRGVVGYDCSGFAVTLLKKAGIDCPWASSSLMKANLPNVPKDQLRPGDLLVKNGHVAVFIGNGQLIESVPGGVRIDSAAKYLGDPAYVGRRAGG